MSDESRIRKIERSLEQLLTRDYVIGEGARVYNSGNISIANNTPTNLTFDSERFDIGGYHSTSTNTGRLTVPQDGIYLIVGNVRWGTNATGIRQVSIQLNGGANIAFVYDEANTVSSDITIQNITTIYELSATDYVELRVSQTSGGNLNVTASTNYSPEFSIWRIG